jgi:26S proteasome regulatory subunit N9
MDASKIPDFLAEQQAQGTPETQTYFLTFEDFWERKLWHQLTDSLVEFFRMKESAPQRLPIFKAFVLSFADRINQLKFVALGLMASTECPGEFYMGFKYYMALLVLSSVLNGLLTVSGHDR